MTLAAGLRLRQSARPAFQPLVGSTHVPKAKCPSCATVVTYAAGYDPICPTCGFRGAAPVALQAPPVAWSEAVGEASTPQVPAPPVYVQPAPVMANGYAVQPSRQQGMAAAALVCGIVALIIPPAGIAAIILGAIAMSQADREPMRYGGKGMAVAGLILGILFFLFGMSMFGMGMWDDQFWWNW